MVKQHDTGQAAEQHAPDKDVVLDAGIQNHLGSMLKRHYDDIVNAPVPDQFLMLLAELEAAELEAKERSHES